MRVHFKITRMRLTCILCVVISMLISFVAAFDPVQDLLAKQDEFRKNHPQEKVHLHTDRVYYSVGDTVYFKACIINAEKNLPTQISQVLHVDLIFDTGANR